VSAKALPACYAIIIQYPERAKLDAARVIVVSETEGVMRIQPAVVGMASGISFMQYCFFHDLKILGCKDTNN
jgi:hypothetical protein